jgi:hypothetical protein
MASLHEHHRNRSWFPVLRTVGASTACAPGQKQAVAPFTVFQHCHGQRRFLRSGVGDESGSWTFPPRQQLSRRSKTASALSFSDRIARQFLPTGVSGCGRRKFRNASAVPPRRLASGRRRCPASPAPSSRSFSFVCARAAGRDGWSGSPKIPGKPARWSPSVAGGPSVEAGALIAPDRAGCRFFSHIAGEPWP